MVSHAGFLLALGFTGGLFPPMAQLVEPDSANSKNPLSEADVVIVGRSPQPTFISDRAQRHPPIKHGYKIRVETVLEGRLELAGIRVQLPTAESGGMATLFPQIPLDFLIPAIEETSQDSRYLYYFKLFGPGTERVLQPIDRVRWFQPILEGAALPKPAIPARPMARSQYPLRIIVSPFQSSFRPNQPIWLEVTFINETGSPMAVPQQRLPFNDWYPFTHLTTYNSVCSYTFRKPSPYQPVTSMQVAPPILLNPGDAFAERIRLDTWQWESDCDAHPFQPGRELRLYLNFDTFSLRDARPSAYDRAGEQLFVSRSKSDVFVVQIALE